MVEKDLEKKKREIKIERKGLQRNDGWLNWKITAGIWKIDEDRKGPSRLTFEF